MARPSDLTVEELKTLEARVHACHREQRALVLHPHVAIRLVEAAKAKFPDYDRLPSAGSR